MALALVPGGAAQSHAMIERAIIVDLGSLPNDDAHAMIDKEPPPDRGPGMDLDPCEPAAHMGQQASRPLQAKIPEPVADAVQPDGMKACRSREHFEGSAGCGVSLEYTGDVFF